MTWYEERGVKIKTEEDGRSFPTTDDSETIAACLIDEAKKYKITILTNNKVKKLDLADENFLIHTEGYCFQCSKLVITAGSSTYFWNELSTHGYSIIPPVPSLFTFHIQDPRIKDLMGLSSPNVHITSKDIRFTSSGPCLVTHWGLSGPAILKLSAWGARDLANCKYEFKIVIDWIPQISHQDILQIKQLAGSKTILANTIGSIPSRLYKGLLSTLPINEQTRWADINKQLTEDIISALKECEFQVKGKSTFKDEFVTAGGVDLKQINFKNFESKLHKGLYMAGEILDIDAITGGFNFQAAWTAGWIIGQSMGKQRIYV
jgi:hypothetical protein